MTGRVSRTLFEKGPIKTVEQPVFGVSCLVSVYRVEMYADLLMNAGRQYDKDGNLRQWWNNGTIKAFRERAQCIIDQYSSYVIEPLGMHVSSAHKRLPCAAKFR